MSCEFHDDGSNKCPMLTSFSFCIFTSHNQLKIVDYLFEISIWVCDFSVSIFLFWLKFWLSCANEFSYILNTCIYCSLQKKIILFVDLTMMSRIHWFMLIFKNIWAEKKYIYSRANEVNDVIKFIGWASLKLVIKIV